MFYVPYSWWGIKGSLAAPISYKTKVFSDTLGFIKASLSLLPINHCSEGEAMPNEAIT